MPPDVLIEMVEEAVTVIPSFCQLKLVGEPEAEQVKVAVEPVVTVVAVGCWVMVGAVAVSSEEERNQSSRIQA